MARRLRYTEKELEKAVEQSLSISEALRCLKLATTCGGNRATFQKYTELWDISTAHFDPAQTRKEALALYKKQGMIPLESILVENSSYTSRRSLKERLYKAGLKRESAKNVGKGRYGKEQRSL